MASEISQEDAGHRILRLLNYLKLEVHGVKEHLTFEVKLTRQQIADPYGNSR